jgi:CBS-domain-containing membrane protein
MLTKEKPFLALTAEDLMSRDLILIPRHVSLRTAAHLLSSGHVSGAPVIDDEGCCVGVLSGTDFVRWAEGKTTARVQPRGSGCVCSDWQMVDTDFLPEEEVRTFMTADPVTVPPGLTITELARRMLDAHIHRLVVVDEGRRPVGIVSTTDILAAVAYGNFRR